MSAVGKTFDYLITQMTLLNAAQSIQGIADLDEFIERIDRAETIAPYTDPTLYMHNLRAGDPLAAMRELAVAAKRFAAALPKACRVCGCTTERSCEGGCNWIAPGLCSSCAART